MTTSEEVRFSIDDIKEIEKRLSYILVDKIKKAIVFYEEVSKNSMVDTYIALRLQKKAILEEMKNDPFTIRGEATLKVSEEGIIEDSAIKDLVKELGISRQYFETMLKATKELPNMDKTLNDIWKTLTNEEKEEAVDPTFESVTKEIKKMNGK
jgi:hypothetical protein